MEIPGLAVLIGMYHLYYKKKYGRSFIPSIENPELFWSKALGYCLAGLSVWMIQGAVKSGELCRKQSLTIYEPSALFWLMVVCLAIVPLFIVNRSYSLAVDDLGPLPGEVKGATLSLQVAVALSAGGGGYRILEYVCI